MMLVKKAQKNGMKLLKLSMNIAKSKRDWRESIESGMSMIITYI